MQRIRSVTLRDDRAILWLCGTHLLLAVLIGSQYPLLRDQALYASYADYILQHGTVPLFHEQYSWVRPFVPMLAAVSKGLTGVYSTGASVMGALSIYLTYKLVGLWDSERLARLSAMAMFCNPFLLLWSSQVTVGTTILAGFLATFYTYFLYRRTGSRRYLYATFLIGGCLSFVKLYGPLALFIVGLHSLDAQREGERGFMKWGREYVGPVIAGGILAMGWVLKGFTETGQILPKVAGHTSGGPLISISDAPPSGYEAMLFFTQALGLNPPNLIVEDLGALHPLLPVVWALLPVGLLAAVGYGAHRYPNREFVWMWVGSLFTFFLFVQAIGHTSLWLYRHFITITPVISLFLAVSYDELPISTAVKRGGVAVLVVTLLSQMVFAGVLFQNHVQSGYEPVAEWATINLDEDDQIFANRSRDLSYRLPNHVVTNDYDGSTILLLNDHDSTLAIRERLRSQRCIEFVKKLRGLRDVSVFDVTIGTLGRDWWVYRRTC